MFSLRTAILINTLKRKIPISRDLIYDEHPKHSKSEFAGF